MEASKKKGASSVSSLALQIRANNGEDRLAGIIASIEARAAAAGGGGGGGKKKVATGVKKAAAGMAAATKSKKQKAPPTDEEFAAAAARLEVRRKAKGAKA